MGANARTWFETMAWIGADPGRAAALIGLAQFGDDPQPELTLASSASVVYQQIAGKPVETAAMLRHIFALAEHNLIERDDSGLKWRMTSLGTLVGRQWFGPRVEPNNTGPLSMDEVRQWRDRLCGLLDEDAQLAEDAGIGNEELLAFQGSRLTELNVLNRVLGEERLPDWIAALEQLTENEQ